MYSVEFIQGVLTASSAFITAVGILYGFFVNMKDLGRIVFRFILVCLLLSIICGADTIIRALDWLKDPTTSNFVYVKYIIFFQFILGIVPLLLLFIKSLKIRFFQGIGL